MESGMSALGFRNGAPFVKVFRTDYSEPRLAGGGAIQVWLVGVASIVLYCTATVTS